jgi:hypothetical protein
MIVLLMADDFPARQGVQNQFLFVVSNTRR